MNNVFPVGDGAQRGLLLDPHTLRQTQCPRDRQNRGLFQHSTLDGRHRGQGHALPTVQPETTSTTVHADCS